MIRQKKSSEKRLKQEVKLTNARIRKDHAFIKKKYREQGTTENRDKLLPSRGTQYV